MTTKESSHIKNAQWDAIAKIIPNGMSIRVNCNTVDIFYKRKMHVTGQTISQISRNQKGWTHRKIFQNQKKDKRWMSAQVLRFDNAETLLNHLEYSEKNASVPAIIERYRDNYLDIQSHIKEKPRPEKGDIIALLEAGADMDDIIKTIEKVFDSANKVGDNIVKMVAPKQIKAILDREIFGNEHAKRVFATAIAKHVSTLGKCLKTNILIVGESGTGKTEMMRALKKHPEWNHNEIPVVIYDASQLTPVGWKGTNMDDILHQVVSENPDLDKVEQAIIQLDEMDKITVSEEHGGGLLKQMLKFIEGGSISGGNRGSFSVEIDGKSQSVSHIDTSRMLFIISGVFAQFTARKEEKVIGFNRAITSETDTEMNLNREKIIASGAIPVELMGRIQAITTTERMTKEQWRKCVEEKILRNYQDVPAIFNLDIRDVITDEAIDKIVEETYGSKQGLRGSINMIDAIVNNAIYEKVEG